MKISIAIVLGSFLASTAFAGEPIDRKFDPDRILWDRINADGTKFALLEGVRDQPGVPFSYAFFIPAGVWDGAHSHSVTARVFIARGTLKLGYGKQIDKTAATAFPIGSYLVVPAGMDHFDGAEVDTIIIGTAIGPWSTHYIREDVRSSAGTASN